MVYIVGAGSGDPELITVKGLKRVENADIIIYAGSLVNPEILKSAKEGCEIHNSAYMNLDEVIEVIERGHKEGKDIVRLHTGDPSIYGAIREQMDILREKNIPFENIAGVSSFCGASSVLQEEYTLPGVTQTVILTRMEGRTAVPEKESIESLSKHNATMIIFLSVGMIEELSERLMVGYSEDTPVAVVYKATWVDQKIVRGTLKDIAKKTKEAGITKTALVIVGNCLGNDYELSKLYDKNFKTEFRG
ncbi:MAG: precorrin-4 C(11)-methyltransferase [Tyzzerella sp.]|uniref:Precorrin-4 C(11)-methyltransferase n=1 Tax=Candidatus Fimicola merdigallinarum TaxID=2840819 RepID=A0A9D9H4I7_9FIRM|nr:precorrin-4 C(11)-methyltransferase [Candidatus Fimicola merdigallinarum]